MEKENQTVIPDDGLQPKPGSEEEMDPKPQSSPDHKRLGRLKDKVVLITGGDSGIGKAVALLFAREGARLAIAYLDEDEDAIETQSQAMAEGSTCILLRGDISREEECKNMIDATIRELGGLDVLINNAATQWDQPSIEDISTEQLLKTFSTNFFSCFWMSKYAVGYMKKGSCIINTTSVTAYRGSPSLIDYASTKGAIVGFTRSLAANLVKRGIRVNAVAPGPVWTPLIVSSFDKEKVANFGTDTPMGRVGEPNEIAPCYLFLASDDNSYMTGQVLHPNGGEIING